MLRLPSSIVWRPTLCLVLTATLATAQANVVPGLDVRLSAMRDVTVIDRAGTFPNGVNGLAFETTVCNEGIVEVPWFQPMNPQHPKIAFLVAAERDGRMVQLSNASYVKHGFFAANTIGCGTACIQPPGSLGQFLGLGCSDTYATNNNGDNFYLGPPDEVDPWLGTWVRTCSLFDRGFPDVGAPANCDGRRSLTHTQAAALGPVNSRVQVSDEELILGGPFYFQSHYVVEGQAEDTRDDNLGSRGFTASWNGNTWALALSGGLLPGTVLARWSGATVTSALGPQDGRVYSGLKVSGPVQGFYRYEYALHNRDNAAGIDALRVPLCAGARVRNAGFRDIDDDPANDWSVALQGAELVFAHNGTRLAWNQIHNFWFESDAAPADGVLTLASGVTSFPLPSQAPLALHTAFTGPGCSRGVPPTLYASGSPARARLGNATFALESAGNRPFEPNFLYHSSGTGSYPLLSCTVYLGAPQILGSVVLSDANGVARHPVPIPNDLALEGRIVSAHALGRVPRNGPLSRNYELSDGLLVRIGDALADCP